MLNYFDTPILEIRDELTEKSGVNVFVKREDLNHPVVSGNKWWKLKYNLEEARKLGYETLLTFGGAFSNHIYATAAAAKETGFKSIGIIRGEKILPLNATLSFAEQCGMKLHFISREEYRLKKETHFINQLKKLFGKFYLVPEGGSNLLAVKGCCEFAKEKLLPIDFDYLCLPVGTGGTMAGIICGLEGKRKVIGFSVLKDGGFLAEEVKNFASDFSGREFSNGSIETNYHFGGYAKSSPELDQFISQMKKENNLPLDFVYTGKMMVGFFDFMKKGFFEKGSRVLVLHTGGLH
ncbi:MAG: 1-aminocyclopropane-1-carboxylate deaminase/D-cysteine desulfhydrase [Bacteroidetes bacterium]|nr:1-aminocyclopropane-1-carboxylate deaminase/D-cysteine desulfhydrase [Bacteroidota bacterium]